ncbi:unnamed protein product, partial [Amoebophrya sp. A120]|eukprot:GSA120T00006887001.1
MTKQAFPQQPPVPVTMTSSSKPGASHTPPGATPPTRTCKLSHKLHRNVTIPTVSSGKPGACPNCV